MAVSSGDSLSDQTIPAQAKARFQLELRRNSRLGSSNSNLDSGTVPARAQAIPAKAQAIPTQAQVRFELWLRYNSGLVQAIPGQALNRLLLRL
jgi:hypothetical protein